MGSDDGWSNEPLNLAFDEASRRGLLIVAAAGNGGAAGMFKTIRPAEATEVLGVGSVDNAYAYAIANVSTYTQKSGADGGGQAVEFVWRDGEPGSGATGWNNMALPLWSNLSLYETGEDCDTLFPDDVPDLSNRLVLVPRTARYGSGCLDTTLADRAAAKGAAYVMLVDNDEREGIEVVRVNTPAIRAIAMTHRAQGDEWLRLLQSGAEVTVNMTAPPDKKRVLAAPKRPGGSRMSAFSQWGPTYDGYLPTSVSAPGDNLLSTKAGGGWIITSGTSLSGPFAAAVAALVAEARGTKDWRGLRSLLSTTASSLVRAAPQDIWDKPGLELASTLQQGAGLVQAMNAIRAPCEISVHKILFNDTMNRQRAVFDIRNPTPEAITYELANIPAGTVYPFKPSTWDLGNYNTITNDGLYTSEAAILSYPTGARVTVPGNGGQATIEVTALDPPGVNKTRLPAFSGWLALNGSDGFDYTIPYMGLAGSIDETPTMHSLTWQRQDDSTIEPGGTAELPDGFPRLAFKLGLAPRRVVTELRDAATGQTLGDLPMLFGQVAYGIGGWWEWLGVFKNRTRVPEGEYVVVVKSRAAFMSAQDESKWQRTESPPLKIKWTR
ncbi:peptidase S8/S53 domain-containing protein [Apiospora rasikravindrae]|uniref:Peptidase S8/S53 domain-containing protein n=1 Tax=Apiospora rasikravindrae TaxID=990691 RepID=A0ABR1RWS1_9PEZI